MKEKILTRELVKELGLDKVSVITNTIFPSMPIALLPATPSISPSSIT